MHDYLIKDHQIYALNDWPVDANDLNVRLHFWWSHSTWLTGDDHGKDVGLFAESAGGHQAGGEASNPQLEARVDLWN